MYVKDTGLWCMPECLKVKYYAKFRDCVYHCCWEHTFNSRVDVNFDRVNGAWNVGQGHSVMMRA